MKAQSFSILRRRDSGQLRTTIFLSDIESKSRFSQRRKEERKDDFRMYLSVFFAAFLCAFAPLREPALTGRTGQRTTKKT
jgi:hypothetical protein